MKNLKIKLPLVGICMLAYLTSVCQAYQQGTFSMSIAGEVLFAQGILAQSHNAGLGSTVKGEYVFGKHVSATMVSGYYFMNEKRISGVNLEDISAIPIKAGLRYYLGSFYGAGELGGIVSSGFAKKSGFLYSVGLGDKLRIRQRVFDIALRHESWTLGDITRAVIGFRIGYEFAINRSQKSPRDVSL
ncbi:MAG TPA: hypothetical protein PLZ68_01620 [Ferruginibacter sp.]|nr:hypothetical protein [Ferruginibacter sp.]